MPAAVPPRLPAALEPAVQRLRLAARDAVERTVESLGLAALAANNAFQRDVMLNAQFELNRKAALFALTFNDEYDRQLRRELPARTDSARDDPTGLRGPEGWEAMTLVDDHELEVKVSAERFGLEISLACEWELRELEGYVDSVLGPWRTERSAAPNPLRPELIGHALIRAVEGVVERVDSRKVLTAELGRSLTGLLRATYTDIIADLRKAGVKPASLTVRQTEGGDPHRAGPAGTGERPASHDAAGPDSRFGGRRGLDSRSGPMTRSGMPPQRWVGSRGGSLGHVDPQLMSLMRRLATVEAPMAEGGQGWDPDSTASSLGGGPLPNLIRAHRDELRQVANGTLDHLVIDVLGSLFDQILSDPRVPPQLARQIARLQLPVLRAALGDPTFFSSRRHPVRRFVNRIASLGAGFDDFSDEGARRFLAKVRELVQEVVEGDFDRLETYEAQLTQLEGFAAEQAQAELKEAGDAGTLVEQRENELRLRALYAQQLEGELKSMSAPEFVRDFIAKVWSQVLMQVAQGEGADSARLREMRAVGRDLFMSVQGKTSAAQRKEFLATLPKLMQELTHGMALIHWPETARREFFGKLLPAHAEALKAQPMRPLDFNMMSRQVDIVLERDLPNKASVPSTALPVLDDEVIAPRFSAEEARRIGLVEEASIDWDGKVDIDLSGEASAAEDVAISGLPTLAEPAEPASGKSLADHVQVGFSYQLQTDSQWQKVRLAHVTAGRSFYVFTRGSRHQRTISLSHRMLLRLCETGRFRAQENSQLLERATVRARRQLAALGGSARA